MDEMTFAHGGTGGAVIEIALLGVALLVVVIMIVRGNRRAANESANEPDDAKE